MPFGFVGIKTQLPLSCTNLLLYPTPRDLLWTWSTASTCLLGSYFSFLFYARAFAQRWDLIQHIGFSTFCIFQWQACSSVCLCLFFLLGKHVLHLDLEGSAYFVLSLPAYFRIPIFLSLVVCYVACCYISLIWPEASQRDSVWLFSFLPSLVSGKWSGFIDVDCWLSLKNMQSRLICLRPHFPFLLYLFLFWTNSDIGTFLRYPHLSHCVYCLGSFASLQWHFWFYLIFIVIFFYLLHSSSKYIPSPLSIHFLDSSFSCSSSSSSSSSVIGWEIIYPIFPSHKSSLYGLPTILIYVEFHNETLRIPSKVILNNVLINRYI